MRVKRFTELFMVRLTSANREKLQQAAHELGMDHATLTRLSIRAGLRVIRRKLSQAVERV